MKIAANQLARHLEKHLLPCYLVSGDEPLLVQEAIDAIRQKARCEGFTFRDSYVATSDFDWGELGTSAGNLSLFAEKRIIELYLPTGKPGQRGSVSIVDMISQTADDLIFFVTTPKLDRGAQASKWVKALEAIGAMVPIWPVTQRELPGWIRTRMQAVGLKPDHDAVRMIADRVEGNLLAGQQEIEKLRLFCGAGPVTASEIDAAVADNARFDVYKLVDAAVAGDAKRSVRILDGVRREGSDAVIVIWALTRELRLLARLAGGVQRGKQLGRALQQAGVWKNRQNIVRMCIGRHAAGDFFALLKLARRADAAAKGQGSEDPWLLTTEILFSLAMRRLQAA